jgi:hypothetical protein
MQSRKKTILQLSKSFITLTPGEESCRKHLEGALPERQQLWRKGVEAEAGVLPLCRHPEGRLQKVTVYIDLLALDHFVNLAFVQYLIMSNLPDLPSV